MRRAAPATFSLFGVGHELHTHVHQLQRLVHDRCIVGHRVLVLRVRVVEELLNCSLPRCLFQSSFSGHRF